MAIQNQGNSGTVSEVDATWRASRVSLRPLDHLTLGHYRIATTVSLIATQAANGTLFSFRWADATRLCVPLYLRMELMQTVAATATIWPRYQVFIARSFTVADSAGTAITLTGNNMKKRTSMGTTLINDIRKSSAAAGLTVGTRTLDAEAILEMVSSSLITTPTPIAYAKALDFTNAGDHPVVLAQNEGLIVRGPTTAYGAAGASDLVVEMAWAELAAY